MSNNLTQYDNDGVVILKKGGELAELNPRLKTITQSPKIYTEGKGQTVIIYNNASGNTNIITQAQTVGETIDMLLDMIPGNMDKIETLKLLIFKRMLNRGGFRKSIGGYLGVSEKIMTYQSAKLKRDERLNDMIQRLIDQPFIKR